MNWQRVGDTAIVVEVAEPEEVLPLYHAARGAFATAPGLVDLVPAATTLLVVFDQRITTTAHMVSWVLGLRPTSPPLAKVPRLEIPVRYNGPDLNQVADAVGCRVPELIEWHTSAEYVVAFCGFAAGFAYLAGGDARLQVARRREPRVRVPAGSVAVADEYTAVYPRESPGGWQLIGRTSVSMWDLNRDQPALLMPGTKVKFVPDGTSHQRR
jgi:KipI family sensor histidine kinase inhibitor